MLIIRILAIQGCLLLYFHPLHAEQAPLSEDALFQAAFGIQEVKAKFQAPLYIQNQYCGDIDVSKEGKVIFLRKEFLSPFFEELLQKEFFEKFSFDAEKGENISLKQLQDLGYQAEFNEDTLRVEVHFPVQMLKEKIINLSRPKRKYPVEEYTEPARFSGFVNFDLDTAYTHRKTSSGSRGYLEPFLASFDSAVNCGGYVWENEFSYLDQTDHPWSHDRTTLLYDIPEKWIRLTALDLPITLQGFRVRPIIGGFGITKSYQELDPDLFIVPSPVENLVIDSPSILTTKMNNQVYGTRRLQPGPVVLRDITGETGPNDVEIIVKSTLTGEEASYFFHMIYEPELLAPGLTEYSYNLGFFSTNKEGKIRYYTDKPVVDLWHRAGITNNLTCEKYLQIATRHALAGTRIVHSIDAGRFAIEPAVSYVDGNNFGWALNTKFFGYPIYIEKFDRSVYWNVDFSFFSRRFTFLDRQIAFDKNAVPHRPFRANVSGYLTIPHSKNGYWNATASWSQQRGGVNPYRINATYRYRITSTLDMNIDAEYLRSASNRRTLAGFFGLSWRIPEKNASFNFDYLSENNSLGVSGNWDYFEIERDVNMGMDAVENNDALSLAFNLLYGTNKQEIYFNQYCDVSKNSAGQIYSTNLAYSSSIVWADGEWTTARSIGDSFILFAPQKNIYDKTVYANASEENYMAKATKSDVGVLRSQTPYTDSLLYLSVEDLPLGYDVGEGVYLIRPSYKRGTLITIGTDAKVLLDATVEDENGKAIAYLAGTATLDSDQTKQLKFFTNRSGKLRILGMQPGTYTLSLSTDEYNEIKITIPEEAEGYYKLKQPLVAKYVDPKKKDPKIKENKEEKQGFSLPSFNPEIHEWRGKITKVFR